LESSFPPSELNLSEDLAGNYIERIVIESIKHVYGLNVDELRQKCQAISLD
jgi:hypothetical protein